MEGLDAFLDGVLTQDVKRRFQVHQQLVSYLSDPLASLKSEDLDRFIDGLASWVSCSNYKDQLQLQDMYAQSEMYDSLLFTVTVSNFSQCDTESQVIFVPSHQCVSVYKQCANETTSGKKTNTAAHPVSTKLSVQPPAGVNDFADVDQHTKPPKSNLVCLRNGIFEELVTFVIRPRYLGQLLVTLRW
ncbi:hypothetical protein BaRGS_00011214 [Batillaria attramentaria]|uniref:Uncharacterized protein n=1 Tax=Batillaria attramentaria TaxID=370345 RepID=A0ABD0LEW4_9CAEN